MLICGNAGHIISWNQNSEIGCLKVGDNIICFKNIPHLHLCDLKNTSLILSTHFTDDVAED